MLLCLELLLLWLSLELLQVLDEVPEVLSEVLQEVVLHRLLGLQLVQVLTGLVEVDALLADRWRAGDRVLAFRTRTHQRAYDADLLTTEAQQIVSVRDDGPGISFRTRY